MKKDDFEDVDDAMHAWMREAHAHDIHISSIAPSCKSRPRSFLNNKGEAKAGKPEAMDAWKKTPAKLLEEYSPGDIYNADKTGLFYKLHPTFLYM